MMMRYYMLRYDGNILKNRELPLIVGQCADADLRLPSDSRWKDENYFVILYRDDCDRWCAVRLSDNTDIKINGIPMGSSCFLCDGDIIDAEETTLKFNVHEDYAYKMSDGISLLTASQRKHYAWILTAVIAFVSLSAALLYMLYGNIAVPDRILSSVKRITVDSIFVQSLKDGRYENVESLGFGSSGTCFVTSDGMLVTARHCIQPWLELDPLETDKLTPEQDSLCRMVMRVETARIMGVDSTTRIVSRLEIEGNVFLSSDFSFDIERDILINYGTRSRPSFWRSIRPSFHMMDNALGDIAWMQDSGLEGSISLADSRRISSLSREEPIVIVGFSTYDGGNGGLMIHSGALKDVPAAGDDGNPCSCLFHNDDASPGDSGGPVLVRRGFGYCVISVLSRKDTHRWVNSSWSVPVSEICVK